MTRLRSLLRRPRRPFRALLIAAAAAAAAGVGASGWGSGSTHYALDPLRVCMAQHGALVHVAPAGVAAEGTAMVDVGGETATLAFARDDADARALAAVAVRAVRHGNLVVAGDAEAPGAGPGGEVLRIVDRCLYDGRGYPRAMPVGYRYPDGVVDVLKRSCRRVGATEVQCRCVLTSAQSLLPADSFQRAVVGKGDLEDAYMVEIFDRCRLVG